MIQRTNRIDPTRTLTIQHRFYADLKRRLKKLQKKINAEIEHFYFSAITIENTRRYSFIRSDEKHAEFMEWVNEEINEGILEVNVVTDRLNRRPWTDMYIYSAYKRGVDRARAELRKAGHDVPPYNTDFPIGATFDRPVHAERANLLFTRVFSDLEGITDAMSSQISRVLADGMVRGIGPLEMASELKQEIKKMTRTRAEMLARTEVVRAHHLANIAEYREAGLDDLVVIAEFVATPDSRVCSICASLAGKRYTLDEAEGVIPVHPRCRCAMVPYLPEEDPRKPYQKPSEFTPADK